MTRGAADRSVGGSRLSVGSMSFGSAGMVTVRMGVGLGSLTAMGRSEGDVAAGCGTAVGPDEADADAEGVAVSDAVADGVASGSDDSDGVGEAV
jgi:hypothetical protein